MTSAIPPFQSEPLGIGEDGPAPVWPIFLSCAVIALLVNFTRIQGLHHSDSIVPVLTSLQHWTPYYWGCVRIGQLIPLLAMPIENPFWNLMFQTWFGIFSTLVSIFLMARYLFPTRVWPLVGTTVACAFFCTGEAAQFVLLSGYQPYSHGSALALSAMILVQRSAHAPVRIWTVLGAGLLLLLAHWVYIGALLIFVPLIAMKFLLEWIGQFLKNSEAKGWRTRGYDSFLTSLRGPTGRETLVLQTLFWMSFGAAMGFQSFVKYQNTLASQFTLTAPARGLPSEQWLSAWMQFAINTWESWKAPASLALLALLLVLFVVQSEITTLRQKRRALWLPFLSAAVATLAFLLFVGSREWVALNGFGERYASSAVLVMSTALVGISLIPLFTILFQNRTLALKGIPVLALAAASIINWGPPSLTTARAALDAGLGQYTDAILASDCTHVTGDYWKVYNTVFHVNMRLFEQGKSRRVWGVTYYGWETEPYWNNIDSPDMRFAVPRTPEELNAAHLTLGELHFCQEAVLPSFAILSRLKLQNTIGSVAVMVPSSTPFASWAGEFYGLESNAPLGSDMWRWCGPEGEIIIHNPRSEPVTVDVSFICLTIASEDSTISIESPLLSTTLPVNSQGTPFSKTITLPPGSHSVKLLANAKPTIVPPDPRKVVFQVRNFQISGADEESPDRVAAKPKS